MKERIGFIGLGSMGKPMAANLVKAGYPVTVTYHRNKAPAQELEALGAAMVDSVREVALRADVVITIVPADRELIQVYSGADGLLENLKSGTTCIDATSALPDTIRKLSQAAAGKGILVLDAPVSGGVAGARNGTLTFMIGGDPGALERCRPILETMGKKIFHTGEAGSGKAVKMINQILNAANTYIASEALLLAKDLGLDLGILCNVVNESSGGSWIFKNTVPNSIIPGKFDGGFKLSLMKKDMELSMRQIEQDQLFMPAIQQIYQIYQLMNSRGNGDKNYSVVSRWVEEQNKSEGK